MQENDTKDQQEPETQDFDFSAEFDSLINARGKITPSLLMSVNRYFLYFSFFESLLLNCAGSQGKSSQYATRLLQLKVVDLDVLKQTYRFFAKRYLDDRSKFESLCGEPEHTSKKVREEYIYAMETKTSDPQVQLMVCLFVCFRLRNNLFHGPKWRHFLEGQDELLLSAGDLIHSILSNVPRQDDWVFHDILNPKD